MACTLDAFKLRERKARTTYNERRARGKRGEGRTKISSFPPSRTLPSVSVIRASRAHTLKAPYAG